MMRMKRKEKVFPQLKVEKRCLKEPWWKEKTTTGQYRWELRMYSKLWRRMKSKNPAAKKLPILFDSGTADFNLDTENPNNIIQKTFQISAGLKMTCKLLAGAKMSSGKVIYPDWAPLIFQNKIKDNKWSELNLSLKDDA